MKLWQRNLILTAIPIAVVTVGCVAAQDDMDSLVRDDVSRSANLLVGKDLRLEVIEVGPGSVYADDNPYERIVGMFEGAIGGSDLYDDVILSALTEQAIGVAFDADKDGIANPCEINVALGSEALKDQTVTLYATHTNAIGELFTMEQRENEGACGDKAGFFFEEDESGPHGTMAMCPVSCDIVASSVAEGGRVAVEMVIGTS